MKKIMWEYAVRVFTEDYTVDEMTKKLNTAGSKGWELSIILQGEKETKIIFKRPCGYVKDEV